MPGSDLPTLRNFRQFEVHAPTKGSKYPIFKVSGPQTIPLMVFGTRVLKYWVLGPSGACNPGACAYMQPRSLVERSLCWKRDVVAWWGPWFKAKEAIV